MNKWEKSAKPHFKSLSLPPPLQPIPRHSQATSGSQSVFQVGAGRWFTCLPTPGEHPPGVPFHTPPAPEGGREGWAARGRLWLLPPRATRRPSARTAAVHTKRPGGGRWGEAATDWRQRNQRLKDTRLTDGWTRWALEWVCEWGSEKQTSVADRMRKWRKWMKVWLRKLNKKQCNQAHSDRILTDCWTRWALK